MVRRRGFTLIEALVALLLGLLVGHGVLTAAARVRSAHRGLLAKTEAVGSFRLTGALLRQEVRTGVRGVDWDFHSDSLWLRAFRGTGLVCPERTDPDRLTVSWRGYRLPDPTKDSVLVLRAGGETSAHALAAVEAGPPSCGGTSLRHSLSLRLAEEPEAGAVVARVYERGAYSVGQGTLRYRRGAGGRQPLGPEIWGPESGWSTEGPGIAVELVERPPAGTGRWVFSLVPGAVP